MAYWFAKRRELTGAFLLLMLLLWLNHGIHSSKLRKEGWEGFNEEDIEEDGEEDTISVQGPTAYPTGMPTYSATTETLLENTRDRRGRFNISQDSILHIFIREKHIYMYNPMVVTVAHGAYLSRIKYQIHHIPEQNYTQICNIIQQDQTGMGDAVKLLYAHNTPFAALKKVDVSDLLIFLGPDPFPWKAVADRGIYIIHFQLEPLSLLEDFCKIQSLKYADEIWHYSKLNVDIMSNSCKESLDKWDIIQRFVPVSYDANSPKSTQKNVFDHSKRKITFLGGLQFNERRECWEKMTSSLPRGLCEARYDIFTDQSFSYFIQEKSCGIFLNLHKGCLEALEQPAEPRLSQLLSAKGLVISQPCHRVDQSIYDGLVDFVNLKHTGRTVYRLLKMTTQQRQDLADSRFKIFKARFDPGYIFKRAGIQYLFGVEDLLPRTDSPPRPPMFLSP